MGRRSGARRSGEVAPAEAGLRLDRWIWFARFQRSREACAELIRKGHVRVNGRRVSQPGADIGIGDVLTLALPGRTLVVEVTALAERRAGAEAGASLYRVIEGDDR
jgi:ribosome-associated heat shock protein Hsp15